MKIELSNNKVFFDNEGVKKEIHPFWLRERVNGDKFVDTKTQQRLFDPTQINENIKIDNITLSNLGNYSGVISGLSQGKSQFHQIQIRYRWYFNIIYCFNNFYNTNLYYFLHK